MTMKDFTFECTSAEDWAEYSTTLPNGCAVDEVGFIPQGLLKAAPGTDDLALQSEPQVWNVNVRADDSTPAFEDIALGNEHVKWIDPATITNPIREWSGGMSYYVPPQVEAKSTKRGKHK